MKTVVTWLWNGPRGYKPEHVNVLASMFRRNLSEHRFVCITNETKGFDSGVELMPIPEAAAQLGRLKTPELNGFPSCYQRLWMFSKEAKTLGKKVLLVDVDLALTASVEHLFAYNVPFVGWKPKASWGGTNRIGGGIYLIKPGAHTEVFEDFKGQESINEARKAGFRGSDQAWISYKLAHKVPVWPEVGIYSVRDFKGHPPSDACLIQFNGLEKPWNAKKQWVEQFWC